MKTLKQKITTPHFILIILIPIFLCISVNIAFLVYSYCQSKQELIDVSRCIDTVFREVPPHTDYASEKFSSFELIRSSMRASEFAQNTEIFLVSDNEILQMSKPEESFLTEDIIYKAAEHLIGHKANELVTFIDGFEYYNSLYKTMNFNSQDIKMIYISAGYYGTELLRAINIILIIASLIFIPLGLMLSDKISKSIIKPIKSLSNNVEIIGDGNFVMLENNQDILEMSELIKSINQMSKRLSDYDKAQKVFLLNASHELRTPLMSIQGYAEGIENGVFDEPTAMATIINDESKRLSSLVEKLLTLSRIENNIFSENKELHNIGHLMQDFVLSISGYALKQNINVNFNGTSENIELIIDQSALSLAVNNIISNCIRYAKTKVNIDLYTKDDEVILKISDDGDGIPKEDLPFIFDRFYKGKGGNVGLGLSISHSAIIYMNGEISAYNDNGAVFEIKFAQNKRQE